MNRLDAAITRLADRVFLVLDAWEPSREATMVVLTLAFYGLGVLGMAITEPEDPTTIGQMFFAAPAPSGRPHHRALLFREEYAQEGSAPRSAP